MKKITSKGKLLLYGMSALGFNMMNLVIGSYLCDALMVEGFDVNVESWTYANKTLIVAGLWSVFILISKVLDGVIDIPMAAWTDKLKSRWGRRRPAILVGMVLTIVAYLAFLVIPSNAEHSMGNTIYFGIMLVLFYSSYTLTLVAYYATFSEIVDNEKDRLRLSNYKTVFDVVYFVLGYALIPALVGAMNIRVIALLFAPLALTMLIPLFMIKERSTLDQDQEPAEKGAGEEEQTVGMVQSVRYLLGNRAFLMWMLVYSALQFGLQLFLTGQNVFYSSVMKFSGLQITLVMAFAFAPVPLTLMLYTYIVKKRGLITGYRYSLVLYLLSMATMMLCRADWIQSDVIRVSLAIVGAILSAFGTGCFFSINYTIPSAIADKERREKGISHPAMFFAVQGLIGGIATGISTGIIWVNLKDYQDGAIVWLMPVIVIAGGLVSYALTYLLPKDIRFLGKE
ncbi:MAG: MFS transporter [Clostridiales bacterium]|nr:MFS transporter [Clostridiales bacterium]